MHRKFAKVFLDVSRVLAQNLYDSGHTPSLAQVQPRDGKEQDLLRLQIGHKGVKIFVYLKNACEIKRGLNCIATRNDAQALQALRELVEHSLNKSSVCITRAPKVESSVAQEIWRESQDLQLGEPLQVQCSASVLDLPGELRDLPGAVHGSHPGGLTDL